MDVEVVVEYVQKDNVWMVSVQFVIHLVRLDIAAQMAVEENVLVHRDSFV
jgi:hypothetical protein